VQDPCQLSSRALYVFASQLLTPACNFWIDRRGQSGAATLRRAGRDCHAHPCPFPIAHAAAIPIPIPASVSISNTSPYFDARSASLGAGIAPNPALERPRR
jgi:hypothetical protein